MANILGRISPWKLTRLEYKWFIWKMTPKNASAEVEQGDRDDGDTSSECTDGQVTSVGIWVVIPLGTTGNPCDMCLRVVSCKGEEAKG